MWAHWEAVSSSSSDQRSCRPLARLPGLWVCALIRPGCISRCLASITVAPAGGGEAGPADLGDGVALDQDVGGHRLAPGDVQKLATADDGEEMLGFDCHAALLQQGATTA